MEKCRRMKRPQCTSKNWIYSWPWKSSRTRQQFYRSESFVMKTDISYEWINGQKPHLIKNGIRIQCNTENFVPIVVPGLSASSSSGSDRSTSRTLSRQERHCSTSSSSSSSSPTTTASNDSETREREDQSGIDSPPVPVSKIKCWIDDRAVRPVVCCQASAVDFLKSGSGCKNSVKILWMQEFPEHRDSHASSSHEISLEPTSKRSEDLGKRSVHTHFFKDRNCEICQRTKISRAPCRRRNGGAVPRSENFGDLITADHKVLSENCESRNNHRYAVVVHDLATQWILSYPGKTKT